MKYKGYDNNYDAELGHDDVIKWKHFPRNLPFVRGIHRRCRAAFYQAVDRLWFRTPRHQFNVTVM